MAKTMRHPAIPPPIPAMRVPELIPVLGTVEADALALAREAAAVTPPTMEVLVTVAALEGLREVLEVVDAILDWDKI